MKKILVTMAALIAVSGLGSGAAFAQTSPKARQNDKNLMRNLGIGLAGGAVYEAVKGRRTSAVLLGAGAAYAGKKYEDARKAQARESRVRRQYVYRNGKRVGYYRVKNGRRIGYVRFRS
jgi:hypothetical protein